MEFRPQQPPKEAIWTEAAESRSRAAAGAGMAGSGTGRDAGGVVVRSGDAALKAPLVPYLVDQREEEREGGQVAKPGTIGEHEPVGTSDFGTGDDTDIWELWTAELINSYEPKFERFDSAAAANFAYDERCHDSNLVRTFRTQAH